MNFRRDPKAEVWRGEQKACGTAAPPCGHRRHYSSTVGQVQHSVRSLFVSIRQSYQHFDSLTFGRIFGFVKRQQIRSVSSLQLFYRIFGSVKCQQIRIKIRTRIFLLSLNLYFLGRCERKRFHFCIILNQYFGYS